MLSLAGLLPILEGWPDYRELLARWRSTSVAPGSARLSLVDAAKPLLLAGIQRDVSRPLVVVTTEGQRALQLSEQIKTWSARPDRVHLYPESETLPYEFSTSDPQGNQERINALCALSHDGNAEGVFVIPARALMRRIAHPRVFAGLTRELRTGDRLRLTDLARHLNEAGYRAAMVVDEHGYFSRRGGILDVFPPSSAFPLRVEFFDDEVDTIREYDPATQRSARNLDSILIPPADETVGVDLEFVHAKLSEVDVTSMRTEAASAWKFDLARLAAGDRFDRGVFYTSPFLDSSLMDYLGEDCILAVDEPSQVKSIVEELVTQAEGLRAELVDLGELPADFPRPYWDWSEILPRLEGRPRIELSWRLGSTDDDPGSNGAADSFSPAMTYGGRLKTLLEKSTQLSHKGTVVIVSQQAGRLAELFGERGVSTAVARNLELPPQPGALHVVQGTIHEGFTFQPGAHGDALYVLSDAEIFGWAKPRRVVRRKSVPREAFLSDIEVGQFVVHVEHGIGHFLGMENIIQDGVEREYLAIAFADNDKLYVPTDQLDRVSKYVGVGEQPPNVSRLGTGDWVRTRERVRAATRELAKDLLRIYAAREVAPGFAFQPDTPWQKELEDSFPYVETPDQIRAIEETKTDMEKPKPMDRLVCGDVGYGKTEVALRAAFKAVMDGRQVAILVPTTVLAQQHYNTFVTRMQAFPVRIEVLSRFRTDKEQKAVIEALKNGSVDICIGTHRLIQKDVSFKDLGLVVIDEEQRFGVTHKERLKKLRTEVDVLTLSATPIPRTLYMAIAGVRDMSTMETPPEDRLPIRTFVAEYNDHLVREAILREMDRGGQVYYVHNRVQSIHLAAKRLAELVPEAIIAVGHGQMPDEQLEQVMLDFAAGKSDVLACSTIIESGLDIPNVNTVIVNHADRFGLAQLYQLRGRVGRGAHRAYSYFLYSKDKRLTPIAEKRLRTIAEATELGSGFRIAMKDLEIRGAGNLLGGEQHGHVSAVGFDLYCRLLADAVSLQRGKPIRHVSDVTMDVPIVAFIPDSYVPDQPVRLNLYQRLANAESRERVGDIVLEMNDRFGAPPEPALNLAFLVQLKILASKAGVKKIVTDGSEIVVAIPDEKIGLREEIRRELGSMASVGNTLVRVDHQRHGVKWQATLERLLERLAS